MVNTVFSFTSTIHFPANDSARMYSGEQQDGTTGGWAIDGVKKNKQFTVLGIYIHTSIRSNDEKETTDKLKKVEVII